MNCAKIFITLLFFFCSLLRAQEISEKWNMENIIPPEVFHFGIGVQSDVGSTGGLNISLPLISLSGRGQMDFPISLNYSSGIRTRQQASWIGLGWNLDPGSITRVVNLIPDYAEAVTEVTGVYGDYPDYYQINMPGLSTLMYQGNMTGAPRFVLENSNDWQIEFLTKNLIGLRTVTISGGIYYDVPYQSNPNNVQLVVSNTPHTTYSGINYTDIDRFILTSPDGTRYVFGLALRSENAIKLETSKQKVMEFVSNWRLTAILSPDYVDGGGWNAYDPLDSNELLCRGNWIAFKYDTIDNLRMRPYSNTNLLMQTTYLTEIHTPVQKAVFLTSRRKDIGYIIPEPYQESIGSSNDPHALNGYNIEANLLPKQLDQIIIYDKISGTRLRKFEFKYAPNGEKLCQSTVGVTINSIPFDSLGKLTLTEIVPYGKTDGALETGYKFEYSNFNPPYFSDFDGGTTSNRDFASGIPVGLGPGQLDTFQVHTRFRTDRFGYFYGLPGELSNYCYVKNIADSAEAKRTNGAVAYSIKKISYPTGGFETYEYESNKFSSYDASQWALSNYDEGLLNFIKPNNLNGLDTAAECGIRVKRKAVASSAGDSIITNYQYGPGHLASPPVSMWRLLTNRVFRTMDRGKNAVEYEYIDEVYADQSKTRKVFYKPNTFVYNKQAAFKSWLINQTYPFAMEQQYENMILIENSYDYKRGQIAKLVQFNAQGSPVQSSDYSYFTPVVKTAHVMVSRIDPSLLYGYDQFSGVVKNSVEIDSIRNQDGGVPISKSIFYAYPQDSVVYPNFITEVSGSKTLITRLRYAFDFFTYNTAPVFTLMKDRNIKSPVIERVIYKDNTANLLNIISAELKEWDQYDVDGNRYINQAGGGGGDDDSLMLLKNLGVLSSYSANDEPDLSARKEESTSISIEDPGFEFIKFPRAYRFHKWLPQTQMSFWSSYVDSNKFKFTPDYIVQQEMKHYDEFAHADTVLDVMKTPSCMVWGTAYRGAKLTASSKAGFTKTAMYNEFLQVSSVTDENGITSTFEYDPFGRLIRVRGPNTEILKEIQYNLKH